MSLEASIAAAKDPDKLERGELVISTPFRRCDRAWRLRCQAVANGRSKKDNTDAAMAITEEFDFTKKV